MKYVSIFSALFLIFVACKDDNTLAEIEGVKTSTLGLSPSNTAEENVKILQNALDSFRCVVIDTPGIYDLDETIFLDDNTKITLKKGVYIRKQRNKDGKGAEYAFINRGAYYNTIQYNTIQYNENIEINGLNLICNGLDDNLDKIQGLVGQISFFRVRNLTIKNFTCSDLLKNRFCIQIAEFNNIQIENVYIEGDKDGIHLGVGKGFVIRNGVFRTLDDPIALNAHDYDVSNPTVGWIEDGLIENCYDLPYPTKSYYFCRILAGSWIDWYSGMKLQKSDIVVNNGRLYRVVAPPDEKIYTSYTPPTHTNGYEILDGINWYMMQEGAIYNAGCKNIHFKDIFLKRERMSAFDFHFDQDKWSRSYYPGSIPPIQNNFTFENIHIENKMDMLIYALTPIDDIRFIHSKWSSGSIQLDALEGLDYPTAKITLDGIHFMPNYGIGISDIKNRPINLELKNSTVSNTGFRLPLHGNITTSSIDIPYYFLKP